MNLINTRLAGRFEVREFIRQGGMGAVYRGLDTQTGQPVAVKQLKDELINADNTILERFAREGEALRTLNHPNIVKMLGMVEENSQHFLILEFISGGSLTDLLNRTPQLPIKRVVQIGLDLSDALTRSHRLKIIHRDIKPANVLLTDDGTPLLSDFGVARVGDSTMTGAGEIVGTYAYLSPEAVVGDVLDTRSDIWSFGVMLYEMVAGRRPFEESNSLALMNAILNKPVPDLEALRPDAPVSLIDLIYRMLEKDRERRISSVRLVGAELEAISRGENITPSTPAEQNHTYVVVKRTDQFPTPSPSAIKGTPHNLPTRTTPFIGREQELREVARLVRDHAIRMVTIVSPGGMGKTRLAIEVGNELLIDFSDGVFFVQMANLFTSDALVQAIAQAIKFTFGEAGQPRQQVLDYLNGKKMLLLFDNFEHLMGSADLVKDILQISEGLEVLSTSRERLNIEGETIYRLEAMPFPESYDPEEDADEAKESSAVQLFIQSARRLRSDFAPTDEDLTHIVRICQLVQGIPLGIVLAATWVEMLSMPEIVREMEQNMDFLETDQRDMPERQRSLRAVFKYSWDLLNEAERDTYKKLSLFQGKFTREAAQQVAGASLKTLMALVNKSLLHRDPASGTYEIQGTLCQYAGEQLNANLAEKAALQEKHANYYLTLVRKNAPRLQGKEQKATLAVLETEFRNIQAAVEWALSQNQCEMIAQATEGLIIFFIVNNTLDPQPLAEKMLSVLRVNARTREERIALGFVLTVSATGSGFFDNDLKPERFEEGRTVLTEIGATRELAILDAFSILYKNYAEVQARIEAALDTLRKLGERWWLAQLDIFVALALIRNSEIAQAKRCLQEALALTAALGDRASRPNALVLLAEVAYQEGEYQAARAYLDEGNAILQNMGDLAGLVLNFRTLALIYDAMDNHAEALQHFMIALRHARESGIALLMLEVLSSLGHFLCQHGDYKLAKQYLLEALEYSQRTFDMRHRVGLTLNSLGMTCAALGEPKEAEQYLREGLHKSIEYKSEADILEALIGLADVQRGAGALEKSAALLAFVFHQPLAQPGTAGSASIIGAALRRAAEKPLERAKAGLADASFTAAWDRGKTLQMAEAVALAEGNG